MIQLNFKLLYKEVCQRFGHIWLKIDLFERKFDKRQPEKLKLDHMLNGTNFLVRGENEDPYLRVL